MADNTKLLQIVGQITLFPESHDQGSWIKTFGLKSGKEIVSSCGTRGCFAGWAAYKFSPPEAVFCSTAYDDSFFVPDPDGVYVVKAGKIYDAYLSFDFHRSGLAKYRKVNIKQFAAETLGLSPDQANWLFSANRSSEELLDGVKRIIQNPNYSPYFYHNDQ